MCLEVHFSKQMTLKQKQKSTSSCIKARKRLTFLIALGVVVLEALNDVVYFGHHGFTYQRGVKSRLSERHGELSEFIH